MRHLVPLALAAALLATSRSPAIAAAPAPPRRVAVVVGANAASPGRQALRFAHLDARNVASVLRLAGFASRDIHVLLDPRPAALLASLDRVLDSTAGTAGETMLVFYYSGHADSRALYPAGKPLALAALRERLDSSKATVRIGIIDACRGGGWTGSKGLSATEPFEVGAPLQLSNEGSVLIASSSGLQDAHESEALRGSFFTHHWNGALRGAGDANEDGVVTLAEAFAHAKALTIRDTALHTGTPQQPSFHLNLRGRRELPLVTLSARSSLVTVEQTSGPLQLVHLDSGVVVVELMRGRRTLRLAVPPGRYLIRRQATGGQELRAREIEVVAGKATRVSEENLTVVGHASLAVKSAEPPARYVAIGIGGGGLTAAAGEPFSQGVSWTLQAGYRIAPGMHLLFNGDYTSFARYQADPDFSQQQSAVTLGARWAPFDAPPSGALTLDLTGFYLKGGIGVAHRFLAPYGSLRPFSGEGRRWGGAVTAGLGWNALRSDTVGFGLELSDSLAIYSDHTRHNVGFNLVMSMSF